MMIRLETSKRTGIDNLQLFEVAQFERNWAKDIERQFPRVTQRTDVSPLYNCHGLTFASHRTRITESEGIDLILADDCWTEITDMQKLLPGDIVVYFSEEGDPNHSGLVVACGDLVPTICSKWGSAGEYIHLLNDCFSIYGPIKRFFRCRL